MRRKKLILIGFLSLCIPVLLEGCSNLIVWKKIADEQREVLLNARLMGVEGELQKEGKVIHIIARRLLDHSDLLGSLSVRSRDFR